MSREHYIVTGTRGTRERFLLWFSDDVDGVVTDDSGSLRVFDSAHHARAFAASRTLQLGDGGATLNLDRVAAWLDGRSPDAVRPSDLLDAWNFLTDVARSLNDEIAAARLLSGRDFPAYDALARSGAISALTPDAQTNHVTPADWVTIASVLRHGLSMFDRALSAVDA